MSCNYCADEKAVPPREPMPCTFQHDEGGMQNVVFNVQDGAEVPSTALAQVFWIILALPGTCLVIALFYDGLKFCKECTKSSGGNEGEYEASPRPDAATPRESMESA
jgi:hypothetical protein